MPVTPRGGERQAGARSCGQRVRHQDSGETRRIIGSNGNQDDERAQGVVARRQNRLCPNDVIAEGARGREVSTQSRT